jgi:YD repeat-containing protein
LTNLGVAGGPAGQIAGYSYLLDASGHRLSVTELSGRTVNFGYDNLYRLTSETIVNDPNSVNGAVSYVYDAVGNRKQKVSTIPGYPGGCRTTIRTINLPPTRTTRTETPRRPPDWGMLTTSKITSCSRVG